MVVKFFRKQLKFTMGHGKGYAMKIAISICIGKGGGALSRIVQVQKVNKSRKTMQK